MGAGEHTNIVVFALLVGPAELVQHVDVRTVLCVRAWPCMDVKGSGRGGFSPSLFRTNLSECVGQRFDRSVVVFVVDEALRSRDHAMPPCVRVHVCTHTLPIIRCTAACSSVGWRLPYCDFLELGRITLRVSL